MLLELQRYNYSLRYRKGSSLYIADTLSRAYLPEHRVEYDADERICQFSTQHDYEKITLAAETSGISDERIKEIQENTRQDRTLQELTQHIKDSWLKSVQNVAMHLTGEHDVWFPVQ